MFGAGSALGRLLNRLNGSSGSFYGGVLQPPDPDYEDVRDGGGLAIWTPYRFIIRVIYLRSIAAPSAGLDLLCMGAKVQNDRIGLFI